ncbi:MAG: SDR family oxidoreductase [Bryobacteraceae bacterium]|nr:SDR family oxidoreductase [Bryobacteraceae bacterium]
MARVALVTGGSRGIGRAIAERLTADGYLVAISYKRKRGDVDVPLAIQADLAERPSAAAMVAQVERELGPVEILVNNAGVLNRGDLFDMNFDEFEAMRKVNVDGLVAATRAAAQGMKQRGWGRIVNVASIAAHGTAFAGTTFYAATKAAVVALTRRFAYELGAHGVTVNAIAPGFIMTDMVTAGKTPDEIREVDDAMSMRAMVRRVGQPADIADGVAYLVSDRASFVTAQVLTIDGGRLDYLAHP